MITELREALVTSLAATGVPVHSPWPERVNSPCLIVSQDDVFLSKGQTFGSLAFHCNIVALVSHSSTSLPELETLVESALAIALADDSPWELMIAGVGAPTVELLSSVEHLGSVIRLSTPIKLGG
jgi:hypothetical protein